MTSFCRYSDLDYSCDLHVIQSPDGIVVMTAAGRIDETTVPTRPDLSDYSGVEGHMKWLRVSAEYHEAVFNAERIRIASPLAGRTFLFSDTNEAGDFVEKSLAVAGFRYPDDLVGKLRSPKRAA